MNMLARTAAERGAKIHVVTSRVCEAQGIAHDPTVHTILSPVTHQGFEQAVHLTGAEDHCNQAFRNMRGVLVACERGPHVRIFEVIRGALCDCSTTDCRP